MANTNTLTTNYSLPVPELGNAVTYDIPRIKSALTTVDATLFAKQDALVSAVNVKTINGNSLLGSGDITISGSGGGSGLTPTTIKTANYTATAADLVRCNSTAGVFSITLPASPADGAIVAILDIGNTFGTNNVTVLPNTSKTIESDTSLILDITGTYVSFVYNSSATNWRLLETPSVPLASNTALVNTGSVTNINGILSGDGSTLTGITLKTINGNALTGSGNITVTVADGALGTPVSGILTNCTGYTYANLTGTVPTWNQNTTGTSSNVTGTVAIANGGTGATTAIAALTALGAQATLSAANGTTNGYLTSADWTAFNSKQAALGTASASVSGILSSANWTTFNAKQAALSNASASVNGILTSADWSTFNAKASTAIATISANGLLSSADKTKLDGIATNATANTGTVTNVSALTIATTGTDVASTVATSGTTPVITLNIPTASATNRGALSSADWTAFNSKQAQLVSATNIKTVNGTTLLGSGDLVISAGASLTGITGADSTSLGVGALGLLSTGSNNSAIGTYALNSNTTGGNNSVVGNNALYYNTTGNNNSAIGRQALFTNTTGYNNSAVGVQTLNSNTTGDNNSAVGNEALRANTTGYRNSAFGSGALAGMSTGNNNSAVGYSALSGNTTGSMNTAVGYFAAYTNQTGSNNVAIGAFCTSSSTTVSNEVNIYNGTITARFQGSASSWSFVSDIRDKTNIVDLELGLNFINKLQPRKFEWDLRHTDVDKGKAASGFIAQEVLSVLEQEDALFTGLVDTNDSEKYMLAQTNLIPILVNAIKELSAELAALKLKVGN